MYTRIGPHLYTVYIHTGHPLTFTQLYINIYTQTVHSPIYAHSHNDACIHSYPPNVVYANTGHTLINAHIHINTFRTTLIYTQIISYAVINTRTHTHRHTYIDRHTNVDVHTITRTNKHTHTHIHTHTLGRL